MKKFFLSCLVGAAAFSASAVETSVTYTYAGDPSSSWGKARSEIYNAAIRINDPALVGKKVTGIRAVINPDSGVEASSLWLSKELKLEKIDGVKQNIPDAFSAPVQVQPTTLAGQEGTFGELSVVLDTPYEITSDGIYAGYSFMVSTPEAGDTLTAAQASPILLSSSDDPNSLYLFLSKSFVNWQSYNSKLNGGAAMIYVTVAGDFAATSLELNEIPFTRAGINKEFTVSATVTNTGLEEISQIGYTYTIDGKEYDREIILDKPVGSNLVNASTAKVDLPIYALEELGDYTLDLKITSVNGEPNLSDRNSASAQISVLPFVPVYRPMLEEFTGTWCQYCTRGYIAMELLNEEFGDRVTLAAYHNGDPMTIGLDYPVEVEGFPSATVNRGAMEDPYMGFGGPNDGFRMRDEIVALMEKFVPGGIEAQAVWANPEKTRIDVQASSAFLDDYTAAGFKVGYLLINNGITGAGTGWIQSNAYSGDATCYGTPLEPLASWPSKVPGLIYNDVVVDITAMRGVEDSLPSEISANTAYESSYSFDIADNKFVQDKGQLSVAAFIINPNGTIYNSIRVKVQEGTGVESVASDAQEVSAEYYNLSGIRVANPQNGAFIKVARLADGTVRTSKILVK